MKRGAARAFGEVQHFYRIAEERTPRWVGILFLAALGGIILVLANGFYDLGDFTKTYLLLNAAVIVTTASFIIVRVYRPR